MKTWTLALAPLVLAVTAHAQSPGDAQRAAMDKIGWLAGNWEGNAVTQTREGESRSVSTEVVRRAAGGTAILIQGKHFRVLPDGGRGDVVHDTAGMITFDVQAGKYRFSTQLADGKSGVFDGAMEGNTFNWRLPLPGAHVRYDIVRNERGQWAELGFYCREGAPCAPIFRMTLDRKGDAP
ncbi:MAG: hypothetical protein ABIR26_14970 [Ramlibacter sp.]